MQRSRVDLEDVADWHNLASAFHKAARAKRDRPEVRQFRANLLEELGRLQQEILANAVTVGHMRRFAIRDPKPRIIHAPSFRERILHHALMAHVGPVLDKGLVADTYACRVNKGTLAAVLRARHHLQRYSWYAKIDIQGYFPSIGHGTLKTLLSRRFKDQGLLDLMNRIIDSFQAVPGRGLPIGALTSQHFANYYLNGVDRLLLESCRVRGLVRYMDDLVWWGDSREEVRHALLTAREYLHDRLGLKVKVPVAIGQSRHGLTFCGYRLEPGRLLLSRRRKKSYQRNRRHWEAAYADGRISAVALQQGFAAVWATTVQADAASWRREQLFRHPLDPCVAEL